MDMNEAVEITTFKLADCSCEDFIAANADVDAWLMQQPGFQSRRIVERSDGTIIDMLIWDSVHEGEAAMHRLLVELKDSPVHAAISQETVDWDVSPVRHFIRR